MLIDQESEERIRRIFDAMGGAISTYLIGRDLGTGALSVPSSSITTRKLAVLEQSYLAGKVASILGSETVRAMSDSELRNWIQDHNLRLTDADYANLKAMRDNTEKWIAGQTADWKRNFDQTLAGADRDWRGAIAQDSTADAHSRTKTRHEALTILTLGLFGLAESFRARTQRLLQTETHLYYQQGQTSEWDAETFVYKLPRPDACQHCMRLHLNADGSPKLHRLADVMGNSNIGAAASDWEFTIGPTHPHCYCTLHSATQNPPSSDPARAAARAAVLKPPPKPKQTVGQMEKALKAGKELPIPHQLFLDAIAQIYSSTR